MMKHLHLLTALICLPAILCCTKPEPAVSYNANLRAQQLLVENELVHAYMTEVNYPDGDYTFSSIKPYYDNPSFSSPAKFAPRPITISWDSSMELYSSYILTIKDEGNKIVQSYRHTPITHSHKIYNLIPGRQYRAVLRGVSKKTYSTDSLDCLTFVPEGQVRMIHVPSVNNVRDMGGWKSAVYKHPDGSPKTIRYGRLYRGGELNRKVTLSDEGRKVLMEELQIGADADFRNDTECAGITTSALEGVDYQRISTASYSASATSSTHAKDFKWILARLREGKNVYYHCVAGADRTGTMGYLLEGILGVCENDQCKDWELTCFYSWRSRVYGEKYDFGTMIKTYFETFKGKTTAENCVAYFKKYGITDEELDEFREIMLE